MGSRSKQQAGRLASFWEQLRGWRPAWRFELGPVQREVVGLMLVIVAVLTLLGLLGISSGSILGWWARLLSQLFGWGGYLVCLSFAFFGLRLLWSALRQRTPIDPVTIIGLELFFLILLAASHMPLVVSTSAQEALTPAQQGRAGGLVGWALAVLLIESLGPIVGAIVLLAGFMLALMLVVPVTWQDVWAWIEYQFRLAVAAWNRWRIARQGSPVTPELAEVPWWEREVDEAEASAAAKSRSGAKRKASKKRSSKRKSEGRGATASRRTGRHRNGGLPPLDLLDPASPQTYGDSDARRKAELIEETLSSFGVPAKVVEINQGPTVTQFGLDPGYIERRGPAGETREQRVRVAKIASLANDLALALAAAPVRIEAPVPGRSMVGLEVPNEAISLVSLRGVMESADFQAIDSDLAIALGEDVSGHPAAIDLGLMPHLLIAGATGSGKSVCINALICCLLLTNSPSDLRMLMVDPKMVELTGYNDIPHLLAPVVVDAEQVVGALSWITRQMDERYKLFHKVGVRNLETYNRRMSRRKNEEPLPKLVVFVDELADLMMVAPDEVERYLCRVAQMGRATGIHLVIATQRPSVDVVTGLIKANFPARISFAVTSGVDSRVILDQMGAENLMGRGDMLFMSPQQSAPVRLQGCYVSDKEIQRITEYWGNQERGDEEQARLFPPWADAQAMVEWDEKLAEAIALAEGRDRISTSFVQRQLRIGFPRAARLTDQMEELGIVGPDEGGGRGREVFLGRAVDLEEIAERLPGVAPD